MTALPITVQAAETAPGDACVAGQTDLHRFVGGPENPGIGYHLVCNGTTWQAITTWDSASAQSLFQVDTDAGACNAAKLGRIRYDGTSTWEYCNGTTWTALGGGGSIAIDNLTDAVTDYANDNMRLGSNTALFAGATGNLFIGETAGTAGTSNAADNNIAIGDQALDALTTGGGNVAIGKDALSANTTSSNVVAIGFSALKSAPSADYSTAVGYAALTNDSGSTGNTAVGSAAMWDNNGGANDNTAVGVNALDENQYGDGNVALGSYTLGHANMQGNQNVAVGISALANNTDGSGSVAVGKEALKGLTTGGTQNTALGYQAGDNITTGDLNIIIGYDIDAASATGNSQLNIGGTIYGDLSNDRIGIGAVPAAGIEFDVTGDIQYTGTLVDISDARLKDNVRPLPASQLRNILALQGVSFEMKAEPGVTELGLIAQSVERVYPELVKTAPGGTKSLNYIGLIGPLVEAMKEQQVEIRALRDMNSQLLRRLDALEQGYAAPSPTQAPAARYNN